MPARTRQHSREDEEYRGRFDDFADEAGRLGKKFGEEMRDAGHRFGKDFEGRGRAFGEEFHQAFGLIGFIFSVIFTAFFLALAAWGFDYLARHSGSTFLSAISNFFNANFALIFLVLVFFSLMNYLSRAFPGPFRLVSPLVTAAGIAFAIWLVFEILVIASVPIAIPHTPIWLFSIIAMIFVVAVIVGYVALLFRAIFNRPYYRERESEREYAQARSRPRSERTGVKRLYRSGKDKILAGVCGGIAEYLDVDPVLIRLLWIASIFFGGAGIILYIISWIIIPRNPNHKWG